MSVLDGSEWSGGFECPHAPLRLATVTDAPSEPVPAPRRPRFRVPKIVDYLLVAAVMLILL
jgi:hypothetical protein